MGRDRTRNAYFTVGIPLDSETYQALKAETEETGISIPQLIAVRITDWYRYATAIGPVADVQVVKPAGFPAEQGHHLATSDLQMRASAAAAAWGSQDDE